MGRRCELHWPRFCPGSVARLFAIGTVIVRIWRHARPRGQQQRKRWLWGVERVRWNQHHFITLNPFTGSAIRDDSGKDLGIDSSKDQWVHIAMTWDGSVLTTYVNGLPKITAQGSGSTTTLATSQSVVSIGRNPTNNNCFAGAFDELRVWNVARTATEIKDNYTKPCLATKLAWSATGSSTMRRARRRPRIPSARPGTSRTRER